MLGRPEENRHPAILRIRPSTIRHRPAARKAMSSEPSLQMPNRPPWRTLAMLAMALIAIVVGTWLGVRLSTDYLLYDDAKSTARNWADYLTRNLDDLEQIAAGDAPSASSMSFLKRSLQGRHVFRYEIYDRNGFGLLAADGEQIGLVDNSDFNERAHQAIKFRTPVVDVIEGTDGFPRFYGRAYFPVFLDDGPVAVVGAYVDQTPKRDRYAKAFLVSAILLCTLVSLAFAIPAIAWYRRTREKEQSDERFFYLAHHDALTGLLNRNSLTDILTRQTVDPSVMAQGIAVHFIDLDRFKTVNDTLGHDGGDILLKEIAARLHRLTNANRIGARIGGDEFVVLQTGVRNKDEAAQIAKCLVAALGAPVSIRGQDIITTISMGVALAPQHGASAERLLKSADMALYKAKNEGRDCVRFYSPELDAAALERIQLEKVLRDALAHDRFLLHFQPIFAQYGRKLAGCEALVRLQARDGTLISPQSFIPIAEDIRIIDKIGAWVLQEACRTAAAWPQELTIAVNLSPAQFADGDLCDVVARALDQSGLDASRLELEITESLLLHDTSSTLAQLQQLKEMGIAIVMDDFGIGYSSLSYLWRFPFDKIKIDRSFIANLFKAGRGAQTVLKSIVALGRELNMSVTIEGVETAQQVEFLTPFDADFVQGYYFGRPAPACDLAPMLMQRTLDEMLFEPPDIVPADRKSA
jgi:diguanylate cyclase (GGDEF)-like protein